MPPRIRVTGNERVDVETALLAVFLRDAGMSERQATVEAQRIRDAFLGAVRDPE
jgi:hypothetical protein